MQPKASLWFWRIISLETKGHLPDVSKLCGEHFAFILRKLSKIHWEHRSDGVTVSTSQTGWDFIDRQPIRMRLVFSDVSSSYLLKLHATKKDEQRDYVTQGLLDIFHGTTFRFLKRICTVSTYSVYTVYIYVYIHRKYIHVNLTDSPFPIMPIFPPVSDPSY